MDIKRLKADGKYILLNRLIVFIPSWSVRRFFLKLYGLKIGRNARIGIGTIIVQPETIEIGDRSIINEYCHLDGRGGLMIGNDVSISIYTKIITASHKVNSEEFDYYDEPTIIEDNVWIGCNAIILNGTYLKTGCVIGAGCVFKGDTVINGIYIGNPGQIIKTRQLKCKYEFKYKPYFR